MPSSIGFPFPCIESYLDGNGSSILCSSFFYWESIKTLDDVNSYVHHRILKKNKVTWSNCTAARCTLPYTFCWQRVKHQLFLLCPQSTILNDITRRLPSLTNDVRMRAPSVCMSNIVQRDKVLIKRCIVPNWYHSQKKGYRNSTPGVPLLQIAPFFRWVPKQYP